MFTAYELFAVSHRLSAFERRVGTAHHFFYLLIGGVWPPHLYLAAS
jgi:hypothetical protein